MLLELLIVLLIGILAGIITGLLPGIHINLVGTILISLSISIFSSVLPIYLIVFVGSMSITHIFIDFIPSIFLGCPTEGTEMSILPGHELLKQGKGYEAVMLTAYGGVIAIFLLIITSVPLILAIPNFYNLIQNIIPYLLIIILILMIFSEKKKFSAIIVIFLTGILGYCVLNLNMKEPLLPLLTGLFGSSSLLLSIKTKTKIPKQKISKKIKVKILKPLLGTLIASPFCGFLPGLGSSQAAIVGNTIFKTDRKGFLTLLGATNVLVMAFSFISLYTIHKERTGTAAAIDTLMGNFNLKILILIIVVTILSGIIAFFLTSFISKKFIRVFERINYSKISISALIFISIIVLIFSGVLGFLIFIISTFTGIYCIRTNVKRTNMMACLLIPTIILYLL